ncbi:unnamed protein product [Dovyalis caffra]|uniref:Bifunctional inhibitor/plant lipid transfer protein/seed storage helical domain-containing protein n=1 Tax=Dovyalis caffra TaxID=77055 RepID=A0AAV1STN6_9ROSI|nr:unnamed protein product [Dovyalis caffra]
MASKKVLSLIILCTISISCCYWADGASHHRASAPAPSVDCSNLILSMADCLSFVSNDSTLTKPENTCCSGLKTVLSTDAACLCEAFKNSAQLGVALNITKALSLPSACKIHTSSATNCGLSAGPAGAPVPGSASGPAANGGANEEAPAPSPGSSGSSGLYVSAGSLIIGAIVASFSSF